MKSESRVRLLLVETSQAGINGSMSRYARLVERALLDQPGFQQRFELGRLRLSMPLTIERRVSMTIGTWLNHLWLMIRGADTIKRRTPDLLHVLDGSYGYLLNGLRGIPAVVTVHDLIPLLQQREVLGPDQTSLPSRWIVHRSILGLRRCQSLISVSGNTRQDLIRFAGMEPSSIDVVPIALDSNYTDTLVKSSAGPSLVASEVEPIVLHVGNNGMYKNREGVLRIFARIAPATGARLKLVGPAPTASLLRLVEELGVQHRVEFIGNVDDQALCGLYQSASLLLFPSLYEGFGWPPLEAMACGCPVVCSSAGSLAEVVGDAALTAPARDEEKLAQLCLRVLQNPDVAAGLRTRGQEHARQFTLKRMGEQLLEVYESILDKAPQLRDRGRTLAARTGA